MSDLETGADNAPTPRLAFGASATPAVQATPVDMGTTYAEALPDEAADYADTATPVVMEPAFENAVTTSAPLVLNGQAVEYEAPSAGAEADAAVTEPEPEAEVSEPVDEDPVNEVAEVEVAAATNLEELSAEELAKLEADAHAALLKKQAEEKTAVIEQIVNVVRTYKITTEELVEALGGLKIKRKGVKAKIKFRDPASGATWSGRGKEPTWMRGRDREQFRVMP